MPPMRQFSVDMGGLDPNSSRPQKPHKVLPFAADMASDRWGLTGDTIKITSHLGCNAFRAGL